MLTKRTMLSAMLLGRSALTIATGMPTSHEIRTESRAISAVSGPRRRIMSATLSDRKNERPKLPGGASKVGKVDRDVEPALSLPPQQHDE